MEQLIGQAITDVLDNDLVRGVVATDALIGTFARADDESLQQNVCFCIAWSAAAPAIGTCRWAAWVR